MSSPVTVLAGLFEEEVVELQALGAEVGQRHVGDVSRVGLVGAPLVATDQVQHGFDEESRPIDVEDPIDDAVVVVTPAQVAYLQDVVVVLTHADKVHSSHTVYHGEVSIAPGDMVCGFDASYGKVCIPLYPTSALARNPDTESSTAIGTFTYGLAIACVLRRGFEPGEPMGLAMFVLDSQTMRTGWIYGQDVVHSLTS